MIWVFLYLDYNWASYCTFVLRINNWLAKYNWTCHKAVGIYSIPVYSILTSGWSYSLCPDWLLVSVWIWCYINIHHSPLCYHYPGTRKQSTLHNIEGGMGRKPTRFMFCLLWGLFFSNPPSSFHLLYIFHFIRF